jgi:hypothetical protein
VIQLTGVASRVVGYATAVILVALGLMPKLGALLAVMPPAVLVGATVALFGLVAMVVLRRILHENRPGYPASSQIQSFQLFAERAIWRYRTSTFDACLYCLGASAAGMTEPPRDVQLRARHR